MAYTPLRTDFKDDILDSSNYKRKYKQVVNNDGTFSFQDETTYQQVGSDYGAKEVNEERAAINNVYENKLVALDDVALVTEEEENGFILSNDGSVYVEPEPEPEPTPEPEPEPYEPTLEDLQEAKVAEMNMAQQGIIATGVDVVLTDGTTEHFTLEDHDQTSLVGLQSQVAAGEENIPWHTSNEAEHCKFYSNKDMKKITATAMAYVTWHVTYFRDLRIYIRSLESKEDVEKVTYGMDIPEAYQSEPLKAMMAQKS